MFESKNYFSQELSGPHSNVDVGKLVSSLIYGTLTGLSAGIHKGSKSKYGGGYPDPAYGPPAAAHIELLEPPRPQRPASFNSPNKRPSTNKKKAPSRPQATRYRPQTAYLEGDKYQAQHSHQSQRRPTSTQKPHEAYVIAGAHNYGTYGVSFLRTVFKFLNKG